MSLPDVESAAGKPSQGGSPVLSGVGREGRQHLRAAGTGRRWQKPREVWVVNSFIYWPSKQTDLLNDLQPAVLCPCQLLMQFYT